jgi:hypothetical protein
MLTPPQHENPNQPHTHSHATLHHSDTFAPRILSKVPAWKLLGMQKERKQNRRLPTWKLICCT